MSGAMRGFGTMASADVDTANGACSFLRRSYSAAVTESDNIKIIHFRTSDRSVGEIPLSEMEPFVRGLAGWRDDADAAWDVFQDTAQRLVQEEGEAFLASVMIEGLSSYYVGGRPSETALGGGEGYAECQRVLRRFNIARLEDFEAKNFNLVLEAFKQRLYEHGLGCYGIGTDSESLCVLIASNPTEFEEIASRTGIELETSWA